jgi:hypothetical protein
MSKSAFLGTELEHYDAVGIERGINPAEDGLRTDPAQPGTYEWWYFDAHLDDGAKLVVTFYTKDFAAPQTGLAPLITIDLDLPDGTAINKRAFFDPATFSASTEGCRIHIAENRFVGDLHEYSITAAIDDVSVDVTLVGTTEPWRPATGQIFYGEASKNFAWLPAVPHGRVSATYRVGASTWTTTGQGYHDHNWGNVPLQSVVNNWYWGRGSVGPYTFITAHIVNEAEYGYEPVSIFMLAKDGKVIADNQDKVRFSKSGVVTDPKSGKPVAGLHSYTFRDGDTSYRLDYAREETVLWQFFADSIDEETRKAALATGYDGAYLRFVGCVTLTHKRGDVLIEALKEPAIWELMYFGSHDHEGSETPALPGGL